jgi:transcription elongation factor Elf1
VTPRVPLEKRFTCLACNQVFANLTAFEMHATGRMGSVSVKRRCRSVEEMRKLGLLQDFHGKWYKPR